MPIHDKQAKENRKCREQKVSRRDALRFGGAMGAAAVTLGVGGCSTLQSILGAVGYQNPGVKIVGMDITKWGLGALGTAFDVEIDNPNPIGFTLQGIKYGLALDGKKLTSGASQTPVSLKSKGKSRTTLGFDFPLGDTVQAVTSLLTKKSVNYALDSSFNVGTKGWNVDVPAKKSGSMPIPSLPSFSVPQIKFTNVSMSGVGLRVVPEVTNKNSFDLPFDGFLTSLKLNGRPVLTNKASTGGLLKSNKATGVPIDLNLGLSDLGLSIASLASKPNIDWDLDLGLKSAGFTFPFKKAGRLKLG